MKTVGGYVRRQRRSIGLFGLFCGIFVLSFALYRLPLKAVWYPALLCAAVGEIAWIWDFFHLRLRHKKLMRICAETEWSLEQMPLPEEILEQDYQRILRRMVEERTAERRQAERRLEDMADYYTTWAHQIKTPIAAMRLTLQEEDSARNRRLRSELFRIEQYVEMVLTFLRLDSPSRDYLIREYDLDTMICQAVKKFAGEFIGRKLQLVYEPVNTRVLTDEKWLSFVIEQLLSNALKYTPDGSIQIELEQPKTLCIRDTGMGIAPEDLPRIFEKGYTGYHGRVDKKASGIGLYLCRRICDHLGHGITAQSIPGQGTTIRLDLSRGKLEVE